MLVLDGPLTLVTLLQVVTDQNPEQPSNVATTSLLVPSLGGDGGAAKADSEGS